MKLLLQPKRALNLCQTDLELSRETLAESSSTQNIALLSAGWT